MAKLDFFFATFALIRRCTLVENPEGGYDMIFQQLWVGAMML